MRLSRYFIIFSAAVCVLAACSKKRPTARKISAHKEISGPFREPQDVTRKCLECHEKVGDDILETRHWQWVGSETVTRGNRKIPFGKINQINNFCIALTSNWPRCTSCHAGYGWKDGAFDFSKKENIDCLVCHDTTGTYEKHPTMAGYPVKVRKKEPGRTYLPPQYEEIARSAGKPGNANCGSCHFFGGGGDAVKHGNLDSALLKPDEEMDVHMGGQGFTCITCHRTENHQIGGTLHGRKGDGNNHFSCTRCHEGSVHESKMLDKHCAHVSCQSCHIPEYGRSLPTKVWWDWSTAGKDEPDNKDKYGMPTYNKKKGNFKWVKSAVPGYLWFRGTQEATIIGDKVADTGSTLMLNSIEGSMKDKNSRIAPFKIMRGKQPYDKKLRYLIVPKLFGKGGFWKTFSWDKAFQAGMKEAGLPYSGSYDWLETAMFWPLNHMVAPKERALTCESCHGARGRLDWKALGYPGDPKQYGGRFSRK